MVPESFMTKTTVREPFTKVVMASVMVPEIREKMVTVDVPTHEVITVTEKKAIKVTKMVPTKVLTEVWESIPAPPCHWDTEYHTHPNRDATSGRKHKHRTPQP